MDHLEGWTASSNAFSATISALLSAGISPQDVFQGAENALENMRDDVAKAIRSDLDGMWEKQVSRPAERLTPKLAKALLTICGTVNIEGIGAQQAMLSWSIPTDVNRADGEPEPAERVARILFDAFSDQLEMTEAEFAADLNQPFGPAAVIPCMILEQSVEDRLRELAAQA